MPTEQFIIGGQPRDNNSTGADNKFALMGGSAKTSFPNLVLMAWPTPGTFRKFRVDLTVAPGSGKSWTWTLLNATTSQSLVVSITDTDTTGTADGPLTVNRGDHVYITESGSSPAVTKIHWQCFFRPDTDDRTVLAGVGFTAFDATTPRYLPVCGQHSVTSTPEAYCELQIPTAGTIRELYVDVSTAPGSGNSRIFTVRKNGVSQTVTATIANTATTASDLSNSFSVAADDHVAILMTASGTPATSWVRTGVVFEPSTTGLCIIPMTVNVNLSRTATEYRHVHAGPDFAWPNTTENRWELGGNAGGRTVTFKNFHVQYDGSFGLADAWRKVTLRKNGAATALSQEDADGTGPYNKSADVSVSDGDVWATEINPRKGGFNNPRARKIKLSYAVLVADVPADLRALITGGVKREVAA